MSRQANFEKKDSRRRRHRLSIVVVIALSAILTTLLVALAIRLNCTWEVGGRGSYAVSDHTRQLLAETQGKVSATCFFDRNDANFPVVARVLRGIEAASYSVAGARLKLRFVDPHWDFSRAAALSSRGVAANTAVFEVPGRVIAVPFESSRGFSKERSISNFERQCVSAIVRLGQPRNHAGVYWSLGHGERGFDTYDSERGFSTLAREIHRAGFALDSLMLPGLREIPASCKVLVVAGATKSFAKAELSMIRSYLMRGGRLLCLLPPEGQSSGLELELERWGVGITRRVGVTPHTYTGLDAVCRDFAEHPVMRGLESSAVVFAAPRCLEINRTEDPLTVVGLISTGAKGWGEATPEVLPRSFDPQRDMQGPQFLALAVERGGNVAKDVSFDPARLVVVGESAFVQNGMLESRAHANAEFFVNALSWLAGMETVALPGASEAGVVFPVDVRKRVLATSVAILPILALGVFLIAAIIRRRRA